MMIDGSFLSCDFCVYSFLFGLLNHIIGSVKLFFWLSNSLEFFLFSISLTCWLLHIFIFDLCFIHL